MIAATAKKISEKETIFPPQGPKTAEKAAAVIPAPVKPWSATPEVRITKAVRVQTTSVAANKMCIRDRYTVDDANAALVPGGVTKYEQEVDKIREVYIANDKSAVTMVVTAQGYHEDPLIRLVVALDPTGAIIGVEPVDFAETEGRGAVSYTHLIRKPAVWGMS